MLGLFLAIAIAVPTLSADIEEVSNKLDVTYEQIFNGKEDAFKELDYLGEIVKYNKQKTDTSTIQGQRIDTLLSMYLLAVKELKEFEKTKDFKHYKHSLSIKSQADDIFRNTPH